MTIIAPDLFACQGCVAVRAEIHRRHFAIRQACLIQLNEEPLGPAIIFGLARNSFAFPIEHRAHRTQLLTHADDVLTCALHRVDAVSDGGIFCGQAKGIEAHWEQHVVALHAHVTSTRIRRRHCIPVTDVQVTAGVGQHRQRIVLLLAVVDHGAIQLVRFPFCLPFFLNVARVVRQVLHLCLLFLFFLNSDDGFRFLCHWSDGSLWCRDDSLRRRFFLCLGLTHLLDRFCRRRLCRLFRNSLGRFLGNRFYRLFRGCFHCRFLCDNFLCCRFYCFLCSGFLLFFIFLFCSSHSYLI